MQFKKGQSGNPNGRPLGCANKRTKLAALLEPHADALINKAVELALGGDTNALRLCIERLIPKARPDSLNVIDEEEALIKKEMRELRDKLDAKNKREY